MMDSLESEDEREKKRKLEEMSEGKSTRPRDDAMFLRREIIDVITRSDEKMDTCLQTINGSVGSQLHGMNTTSTKMKEEGDDRYKQINEIIANMEKKSPTT